LLCIVTCGWNAFFWRVNNLLWRQSISECTSSQLEVTSYVFKANAVLPSLFALIYTQCTESLRLSVPMNILATSVLLLAHLINWIEDWLYCISNMIRLFDSIEEKSPPKVCLTFPSQSPPWICVLSFRKTVPLCTDTCCYTLRSTRVQVSCHQPLYSSFISMPSSSLTVSTVTILLITQCSWNNSVVHYKG
jgi:hypothetical protein